MAVVGYPHPVKGEGIFVYVTLKSGVTWGKDVEEGIIAAMRKGVGAVARPDKIMCVPALPVTRSGKIVRRILRKVAAGEVGGWGDVSTLADTSVLEGLVAARAALG